MRSFNPLTTTMVVVTTMGMATATAPPTVTVTNGTIQGGTCPDTGANYFLSIPYALPPIGNLRFAPPQQHDTTFNNNGTLRATSAAPSCIQFNLPGYLAPSSQSEDCLYLDVWTPPSTSGSDSAPLPVKVWLYGGYNEFGSISDPLYDGCYSAADAVIVTINYRVGPLGWFALEEADLMGNLGLQDALLGLRWVQENIESFGGDPSRVLVFSQSAGSINSFTISTLPEGPSLMNALVIESADFGYVATISQAEKWNQAFAADLNCNYSSAKAIQTCLRAATVSELNSTTNVLASQSNPSGIPQVGTPYNNYGRGSVWGPLVDGNLVPYPPVETGSQVLQLVAGSNANEGTLYVLLAYGEEGASTLTEADYEAFLTENFGPYASLVNETYPLSLFNSTALPVFEAMSTVFGHAHNRCPTQMGANASTVNNGAKAYSYSFNHTPSCSWQGRIPNNEKTLELLGATHTSEIPFVFGHTTNLPPASGACNFTSAETKMSKWMMDAWTNMARDGAPGQGWPVYEAAANWSGLGINFGDSAVVGPLDYSMCEFWAPLWEKMLDGVRA